MLRVLRRRGWVLLVTVAIAIFCAYAVASTRGKTYTAQSSAVVASNSSSQMTPDGANLLAGTYAALIPNDTATLRAVATAVGASVSDVQGRLSVLNTTGTALLTIDYRGTSAANSITGATAALKAITGSYPVSPNIIPGSVSAVRAPTEASASRGVATLVAIGAILGIALGILLMIVWERVDPRIDTAEDLSQEIGSPASSVGALSQPGANALIARWTTLADHGPSRIALVPVTADAQVALPEVALRFSKVQENGSRARENSGQVQGNGAAPTAPGSDTATTSSAAKASPRRSATESPAMIAFQVPSADLSELQSIMDCDLVVLVARIGTPRAALRELLDSLTEFGVSPKWAIFLGTSAVGLPGRAEAR